MKISFDPAQGTDRPPLEHEFGAGKNGVLYHLGPDPSVHHSGWSQRMWKRRTCDIDRSLWSRLVGRANRFLLSNEPRP